MGGARLSAIEKEDQGSAIVIAHRGDSGAWPEHTIEAYLSGIEKGADYIEPDLVMTKDGVLVARHDVYLSTTTNVGDIDAYRGRKRTIDGKSDWYVFDFNYAELKGLRARQPFPGRSQAYDDQLTIPSFAEILSLVRAQNRAGRTVGLYPEMKRPDLFAQQGLDVEGAMLAALRAVETAQIPVFFQSFDPRFLAKLKGKTTVPLIFLIAETRGDHQGGAGEGRIKPMFPLEPWFDTVDGFGLSKALLAITDADGRPGKLVRDAHKAGKLVHVWTLRDDRVASRFADIDAEISAILSLGVDGFFTDFPGTGRRVVDGR